MANPSHGSPALASQALRLTSPPGDDSGGRRTSDFEVGQTKSLTFKRKKCRDLPWPLTPRLHLLAGLPATASNRSAKTDALQWRA